MRPTSYSHWFCIGYRIIKLIIYFKIKSTKSNKQECKLQNGSRLPSSCQIKTLTRISLTSCDTNNRINVKIMMKSTMNSIDYLS